MGLYDAYWANLSEKVCPVCGSRHMEPDGDLSYCCPECGHRGDVFETEEIEVEISENYDGCY